MKAIKSNDVDIEISKHCNKIGASLHCIIELSMKKWTRFKNNCIIISGWGVGNSSDNTELLNSNVEYEVNKNMLNVLPNLIEKLYTNVILSW